MKTKVTNDLVFLDCLQETPISKPGEQVRQGFQQWWKGIVIVPCGFRLVGKILEGKDVRGVVGRGRADVHTPPLSISPVVR